MQSVWGVLLDLLYVVFLLLKGSKCWYVGVKASSIGCMTGLKVNKHNGVDSIF